MIEQGQLVQIRNRFFIVQDVRGHKDGKGQRVTLECMDDDRLGDTFSVIWEREINPQVYSKIEIPDLPSAGEKWDSPHSLNAFLRAVNWSSASVIEGPALSAPFRAAIDVEDFQLEPVVRAVSMPRVCLLIADDVGLGKTIEAGMVAQEMIARGRVRRILIVCPASLQKQWYDEMRQKFNLPFEIIDRTRILELRREYGVHVNPWNTFPRIITSMDFLKREQPLKTFRESLKQAGGPEPLREWDLLIVDEAHNTAPPGRSSYVVASDRTKMMESILDHFEHRLFLTATPHNGFTESFTALLEMLDPLRFTRSGTVDPEQVRAVMVRRLKDTIVDDLGDMRFKKRQVTALESVKLTMDEQRLFDLLEEYSTSRRSRVGSKGEALGIEFALTILKKRLLSSVAAFNHSLDTHSRTLGLHDRGEDAPSEEAVKAWQRKLRDDWDDDEEHVRDEDAALEEATPFFGKLTADEQKHLGEMLSKAGKIAAQTDSKAAILTKWIEEHLLGKDSWNGERVVIFTEYLHTLEYLEHLLAERGWSEAVMRMTGGMTGGEREEVKEAFQAPPDQHPLRILLATDAASEGLNLQNHCRYLIHYEIPWNPNKMEQRNGRIDRKGQRREPICWHFEYADRHDQRFLDVIVDKVRRQRHDLQSVGEVIARQMERVMLGAEKEIRLDESRLRKAAAEVQAEVQSRAELDQLLQRLEKSRDDQQLHPEVIRQVLDEALKLEGHKGLEPVTDGDIASQAWRLGSLPESWATCRSSIEDSKGRKLKLIFEHQHQNRKDGSPRRDVALVHLNHPLMQRAFGFFRKNIWSQSWQTGVKLRRVSYRVTSEKSSYVILHGRVVAISEDNRKLHEAVLPIVCRMRGESLTPLESAEYRRLVEHASDDWPAIPTAKADQLRGLWPHQKKQLEGMLNALESEEEKRLKEELRKKGVVEAQEVRAMIDTRIKEVTKRLAELSKIKDKPLQLSLFDEQEQEQVDDDIRFLEARLSALQKERETRPDEIKRKYKLRTLRVFPLAVEYILSESLVGKEVD